VLYSPRYTDYDAFAWLYDRYWGSHFVDRYWDIVERLFLTQLGKGRNVLDLCCGSGRFAARLSDAGYRVSGIDGSNELLKIAHRNAPTVDLTSGDARSFTIIDKFDGAISTFDSMNHIPDLVSLGTVFNNVYSSLKKNGVFMFDMNMEDGFKARWHGSASVIETDHVMATTAEFNAEKREGLTHISAFVSEKKHWKRTDVTIVERCYPREDIANRLSKSLFRAIKTFDSHRDLGRPEVGRIFFICSK
jgi:SAM-dependent methyltransferase